MPKRTTLRGLSPVVSVVLMVAVAISIGIIVTTWVTHWIQEETSSPDISCAMNTNYVIDSVEWSKAGYNNSLLIKITNKGKQRLHSFGVIIDNGTKILVFNISSVAQGSISSTSTLDREHSAYISINLTNNPVENDSVFGASLVSSNDVEVRVTNSACDAVSAVTNSVS